MLLESEKNKICNLRLEGRKWWNYQRLYKVQNMLLVQISAVVWGKQEDPWAAGRLLRHCCKLWAPSVGVWLLLWDMISCFPLLAGKSGSHFYPSCSVVSLSRWFVPGCLGSPLLYIWVFALQESKGKAGVVWRFGIWIRDYCTAGCAWWGGGKAEFEVSVAHSHPLLMIPKKSPSFSCSLSSDILHCPTEQMVWTPTRLIGLFLLNSYL